MKVADYQVSLSSQRQYTEEHIQRESLLAWRDGQGRVELENRDEHLGPRGLMVAAQRHLDAMQRMAERMADRVQLSPQGQSLQAQTVEVSSEEVGEMSPHQKLQFLLLKALVERLTGSELEVFDPAEVADVQTAELPDDYPAEGTASSGEREGWGLRYDYYESHYEYEAVQFRAQAEVHTADGQIITLDLELNMSREFRSTETLSLRAGDALKDPLVINFDGNAAQLSDTRFAFDLDADGREEQIAFVNAGSGFLALDGNDNGRIDDGSELFGALSGNGFAELSNYDSDGNGWIDEADSIYDRLRIWSRDSDGHEHLVALGDRNVGAIYLGHIGTEFKLTEPDNRQLGQVRSTGLFLGDDGSAGTVQQIDLVV